MRLAIITILILLAINPILLGQYRTIHGRVIDEDFETLPQVRIQTIDTIKIGETDIEGRFKINIPQKTDKLLISWIGMEWTIIQLKNNCDTIEIVLLCDAIYDFMSSRKIDRLRRKRFNKLPEIHKIAFQKGIFATNNPCFTRDFVPNKPRLDEISKNRKKKQ